MNVSEVLSISIDGRVDGVSTNRNDAIASSSSSSSSSLALLTGLTDFYNMTRI